MARKRRKLIKILTSILFAGIFMSSLPSVGNSAFHRVPGGKKIITASVTLRPPQDYVEKKIGPDGGSLYLDDGTGIVIPKGALTKWVCVFIKMIKDLESLPSGNRAAMPVKPISAYEFGASELPPVQR